MPKPKRDYFEEEVVKLMKIIAKMIEDQRKQKKDPNAWLQTLYQNYSTRLLSDNSRIWSTGSILIPISLAGFAAVVGLDNPQWTHVAILMFASITIMFIWLVIAENHRAFQQKSEAWIVAIERTIKLEGVGGPKVKGNFLNRLLTGKGVIQNMRWYLFFAVVLGWIGILVLTVLNLL
jgi:hypothetical protein